MCVANVAGDLVPLNRAGYHASSSPYIQHHVFVDWVEENYERFTELHPGERICGEWLAQAHGTLYDLTDRDPFVAFDLFRDGVRQYYHELRVCYPGAVAPILRTSNHGMGVSVTDALAHLGRRGMYGAQEHAEGCVWRWERPDLSRNPIMLAKYVRPEKAPGKYLEGQTGREPIWNWTLTREEPKNENTL